MWQVSLARFLALPGACPLRRRHRDILLMNLKSRSLSQQIWDGGSLHRRTLLILVDQGERVFQPKPKPKKDPTQIPTEITPQHPPIPKSSFAAPPLASSAPPPREVHPNLFLSGAFIEGARPRVTWNACGRRRGITTRRGHNRRQPHSPSPGRHNPHCPAIAPLQNANKKVPLNLPCHE